MQTQHKIDIALSAGDARGHAHVDVNPQILSHFTPASVTSSQDEMQDWQLHRLRQSTQKVLPKPVACWKTRTTGCGPAFAITQAIQSSRWRLENFAFMVSKRGYLTGIRAPKFLSVHKHLALFANGTASTVQGQPSTPPAQSGRQSTQLHANPPQVPSQRTPRSSKAPRVVPQ